MGDYGHFLVHGMTAHLPRVDDKLRLERAAPFIPPITFPGIGDILVTDHVRKALAATEFVGIGFRPVVKARIVRLDWQRWDKTSDEPKLYPPTGEPEDYILRRRHSAELSRRLVASGSCFRRRLSAHRQSEIGWFLGSVRVRTSVAIVSAPIHSSPSACRGGSAPRFRNGSVSSGRRCESLVERRALIEREALRVVP